MTTEDNKDEAGVTFEVVEGGYEGGKKTRHRGIYLLPNLFTTAALFAGFYGIVAAMNGSFEIAAISICVAAVLDGVDGGVARLTNTQSEFGAQYDSMSDLVAFGVAPALVAYSWALVELGKFGWLIAFLFVACAAMRLARFNVQLESSDKKFFTGLPSPTAAGLVATMIWLGAREGIDVSSFGWMVAFATASMGLLMVSNVKFHSFKEFKIGRIPFPAFFGVTLVFLMVTLDPPAVLLTIGSIYVAVGLVQAFRDFSKNKNTSADEASL